MNRWVGNNQQTGHGACRIGCGHTPKEKHVMFLEVSREVFLFLLFILTQLDVKRERLKRIY